MSQTHDIDNEEPFLEFDPYSEASSSSFSPLNTGSNRPRDRSSTLQQELATGKGKELSKPMPITLQNNIDVAHDLFDMTTTEPGSPTGQEDSAFRYSSSPPLTPYSVSSSTDDNETTASLGSTSRALAEQLLQTGKGKDRELDPPPTLPPLTFSPTEFSYDAVDWPSSVLTSTPGPSSFGGSGYGSPDALNSASSSSPTTPETPVEINPTDMTQSPSIIRRMPSRRRSFSNLSIHSTRSFAARSVSKVKVKFGGTGGIPSNLARKLLFRKRDDLTVASPVSSTSQVIDSGGMDVGQGSCFLPWRADFKSRGEASAAVPYSFDKIAGESLSLPLYYGDRQTNLKGKGRSYSSPLPLSALDLISPESPSADVSTPIPLIVRDYFDESLPKELQLHIFRSLVAVHESAHERSIIDGRWAVSKATSSRNKWVGKDKGFRELVKLSRVSKSWQTIVFDGQLWTELDLHSFPRMPLALVMRLSRTGGAFIRSVDFSGHANLLPSTLLDITDTLCLNPPFSNNLSYTQLTSIKLRGCSALTTRSLHHLLINSPSLREVSLKGLDVVTNTTCDVIAAYCPRVTSLDMSRCSNMDASGIRALASAALDRGEHLLLKDLRLSGLKHVTDAMMATLGKAAPHLEVLDLSYARQLHNSAVEAFISCDDSENVEDLGVETIVLTAREAGRDSGDFNKYRRRVTRLRHLSLSSCLLLTDTACSNLAHSVPKLEFLELAGIGAALRDDGLVRLLDTTPFIRRLDLEDASSISNAVIAAITPSPTPISSSPASIGPPEPGHALEQLMVSYAADITDDAFLSLVRNCRQLRVLEADNTRMGAAVLREFVRLSRQRQTADARIVAIDCRGVGENVVKELSGLTRPRKGWRAYDARKLKFLDGRDGNAEDMKAGGGQDECDESRIVLKTFYSWQTVDAVRAAREKRRKSNFRRMASESSGSLATTTEDGYHNTGRTGTTRWWTPGGGGGVGRRSLGSGVNPPLAITDMNHDRDGCRIM